MILVTGGAGYIGSHTCVMLLESGYDIVAIDNFSNSHPEAIKRVKEITGADFPFHEVDLNDNCAIEKICKEYQPECVIHFAGLKAVGESVSIPIRYYENNIGSTINLLKSMDKYEVRQIIFSSSATVYSETNTMPLTENAKKGCTNPYGWTKFMCEQIIEDATTVTEGLSAVLLRYFNPVGAHESGLIGENPKGIPNNLMPYIADAAAGKYDSLPVYGADYETTDGTGVRDYIHVMDLVAGHVAAVKFCAANKGTHVFNLGTGKGTSVLEMINAFEKASGTKVPYHITDRRPGDIAICYADPSKAEKALQWRAERTLDEMCASAWNWQVKNPRGYQ